VACFNKRAGAGRRDADAAFMVFELFGDTDNHCGPSVS